MAGMLISPELETFPNRYRWKVEDCHKIQELGILDGRFEVIDGEVIEKKGQNPPHFFAVSQIARWASRVFGDEFVRSQGPISLSGPDKIYSEPEQDVSVTILPDSSFALRHPLPHELRLVVEVSDTSARTDLLVKASLYARSGIAEYWVIDLNTRTLHCHRSPEDGAYTAISTHASTETVATLAVPEAATLVSELLPPDAS